MPRTDRLDAPGTFGAPRDGSASFACPAPSSRPTPTTPRATFYPSGDRVKQYIYYPGAAVPLCCLQDGQSFYYHTDHLGTPMEITDDSGQVVWSAVYDTFGTCHADPRSTFENHLRFPGQYQDTETGLHYNVFRYYDPETGQYISQDPIGYYGRDYNLYRYVRNDPMNAVDPYGLNPAFYAALVDFVSGFLVPGPPPPTFAGGWGYAARETFDAFIDIDKVANYLKDAWIDYLDDDMVYRQFKYQNEMKRKKTTIRLNLNANQENIIGNLCLKVNTIGNLHHVNNVRFHHLS